MAALIRNTLDFILASLEVREANHSDHKKHKNSRIHNTNPSFSTFQHIALQYITGGRQAANSFVFSDNSRNVKWSG